jgi:cytoskeletal protein CcmA (bactofilin family)
VRNSRGFGLGNTLVVIGVASTLAFTVAAGSMVHLNFSTRVSNGEQAQNLAESALAEAAARVLSDPLFGTKRVKDAAVIVEGQRGVGRVTFNQTEARDWGMAYSTNNLEGSNPIVGFDLDRPVPKAAMQLVGQATVGGVTRTVETVIYIPPFPYAIASAGPFRSTGKLEVGAVGSIASVDSLSELDASNLLAAHLASNGTGKQALVLGPDSHITGDVRAAGEVALDPGAQVAGEVRANTDPVQIPKENVRTYDPELLGKPNIQKILGDSLVQPALNGFAKRVGNLFVSNGLKLDNGVLFVDGDVTINGGIQGSGALFVTRNLSVNGSSAMSTDNTVAVMAGGNVSLIGNGTGNSAFQGLLYTEGSFKAKQISLMGVFIQNNPNETVEISDSRMIYVPEYSTVEVDVGKPTFSLADSNILLDAHGKPYKHGEWGKQGPVAFDAHPVASGGWDLTDPNEEGVKHFDSIAEMAVYIEDYWDDGKHKKHHRESLYGLDANGQKVSYRLKGNPKVEKLAAYLTTALVGAKPLETVAGTVGGVLNPQQHIEVDPSRFLALKERARVLYWKAR